MVYGSDPPWYMVCVRPPHHATEPIVPTTIRAMMMMMMMMTMLMRMMIGV
eukprot:COSAG05_NODE_2403_length_3107_cov_1.609375_2_plen_50_part_00